MDHSQLPLINRVEYSSAKEGARNEVCLLKSIYNHPECASAKALMGRDHKVVAVFDTLFGGKATVVTALLDSQSKNRRQVKCNGTVTQNKENDNVS